MNSASEKKYRLPKLVSRILKISLQFIAGTLAAASVIILALLWRMSEGPVSLNFLHPHLEHILSNSNSSRSLAFKDLSISWSGWESYILFEAKHIAANTSEGELRLTIPKIAVQVSVPALFSGKLIFEHVEITDPNIEISLPNLQINSPNDESATFIEFISSLLADVHGVTHKLLPVSVSSQMKELTISKPMVAVSHSDDFTSWKATGEKWTLKQTLHTTDIVFDITLEIKGTVLPAQISAQLEKSTGIWNSQLSFSHLSPLVLAKISRKFETVANLNTPLSGELTTKFSDISKIQTINFKMTSPGGLASFNENSWFTREHEVENVQMTGEIILDNLAIVLDSFNGIFDGVEIHGSAALTNLKLDPHINAEFNATQISMHQLAILWPENLGRGARQWVVQNITGGILDTATAYVNFSQSELISNTLDRGQIFGQFHVSDTNIKYMNGLPPAQDVMAMGWFDGLDFHISINDGKVLSQDIGGTKLDFIDIYTGTEIGILQLQSRGPLADFLLLSGLSQNAESILPISLIQNLEGHSTAVFDVRFPLIKGLAVNHLTITGELKFDELSLEQATTPFWETELKLSNGTGTIAIDGAEINGKSTVSINNFPAKIGWTIFRGTTSPSLTSKATISATVYDISTTPWKSLTAFTEGETEILIELTLADNNKQDALITVDISNNKISFPALNFSKNIGLQAHIVGKLKLNSWIPDSPLYFEVVSDELAGSGMAELNNNFQLTKIVLDNISTTKELFTTEMLFTDNALQEIDLQTESFEISSMSLMSATDVFNPHKAHISATKMTAGELASLTDVDIAYNAETPDTKRISVQAENLTLRQSLISLIEELRVNSQPTSKETLNIYGAIKRLQSAQGDQLLNVQGQGVVRDGELAQARVEAYFNDTENIRIELTGSGTEPRITVATDNAGKFLQMLGITSNLIGGRLYLEAKYDSPAEGEILVGHCTIMDFHLTNTPLLAQLLSISLPTNVFELLAGKGLPFARLHAPFEYGNSTLTLRKARATGISLGITADGKIDLSTAFADLQGTIIPAYLLNNIVGTVPVIGDILTGPEKEGIFAATYTAQGPADDLEIFVNPLTVLAPGILREFFNLFFPDKPQSIQ